MLLIVFFGGLSAIGGVYMTASARMDQLQLAIIKQDAKSDLIQRQMDNDEKISRDQRDSDKAFASEVRANLSQITQSIADLRTLVATQRDGHR